jgi:SAM-dependent methyltransferase
VIDVRRTAIDFLVKHQLSWRYRYLRLALQDARDFVWRKRQAGIPPRRLQHFVGYGDFRAVGEEFLILARELGGLKPDDRVLDVGSGLGRMAIPLTRFLSAGGTYDGLEIMPRATRWCEQNITPTHPSFRFHNADVYNRLYNPKGRTAAETFVFPFDDHAFDFAVVMSVFTHMLPLAVEQYLAELGRVLKPGAIALVTAFLLDPISRACIDAGSSALEFTHPLVDHDAMTIKPAIPEAAIAYPVSYFEQLVASSGLVMTASVYPGTWSGRRDGRSTQDVVILKAPEPRGSESAGASHQANQPISGTAASRT